MLRYELRLVVILATLALLVVLVFEWNVDESDKVDGASSAKQFALQGPTFGNTSNRKRQKKSWYTFEPLPNNVIGAVDRFVFFVGYARSGHSIVASLLDAHPNVVIAHEYALINRWSEHPELYNNEKSALFNTLYNSSRYSAQAGLRRQGLSKKGYSLDVPGWYQGSYEGGISVIGDKAGGMTAQVYRNNRSTFLSVYQQLQTTVTVPVSVIHIVRNPYDNIATMLLYNEHMKRSVNTTFKYNNVDALRRQIKSYFTQVKSVLSMIDNIGLNDITIHHSDFITNPKATMRKLCNMLYITCNEQYLHMVAEHTYTTESHSRDLVKWTPELIDVVARNIAKIPLLKSYKFSR